MALSTHGDTKTIFTTIFTNFINDHIKWKITYSTDVINVKLLKWFHGMPIHILIILTAWSLSIRVDWECCYPVCVVRLLVNSMAHELRLSIHNGFEPSKAEGANFLSLSVNLCELYSPPKDIHINILTYMLK